MDFYTNDEMDFVVSDGGLLMTTDPLQELKQELRRRLTLWWNEWFMNLRAGQPYREMLFATPPDVEAYEGSLRETLLTTPGVNTIVMLVYEVDRPTRRVTFTIEVNTTFGPITLTV